MPETSGTKIVRMEIDGVVYVVSAHYAEPEEQETVVDKIIRLARSGGIIKKASV